MVESPWHMPDYPSFFDPDKARGADSKPDVGQDVTDELLATGQKPMTVSTLLARIKDALAEAFPKMVTVVGEISNVKLHASGHLYFRLKDASASIDVAMFRAHASRLRFKPEDGLEVVIDGRVDVYDVRGQLQLYAERMTPRGAGALELAFRQLREKLAAEGLFDPAHKKPIPRFPRAIGVVTSPTGAAIRDIRRTLLRRWKAAKVYLVPSLVQGAGAAEQVAEAIHLLDAQAERYCIDTIIVARGGGSLEDLWAFNEEIVARAIFAARTPIISGIGHEVDVTIADLVADLRAPTPTGAAELAVPNAEDILGQLVQISRRLDRLIREDLRRAKSALEAVSRSAVFRDPAYRLRTQMQRLDELTYRLRAGVRECLARGRHLLSPPANRLAALHPARLAERAKGKLSDLAHRLAWVLSARSKQAGDALAGLQARLLAGNPRHRLGLAKQQVAAMARQLDAMSYRNVLRRGFSVTRQADRTILRSATMVQLGQRIETELMDGKFRSVVSSDLAGPIGPKSPASRGQAAEPVAGPPGKPSGKADTRQRKLFDSDC